jgi:PleD family two-component response regulator
MYLQIMDSKIQVESTPGKGSRFWFELPVEEVADVNDALTEPKQVLKKEEVDNARLLIVEDDDFGRLMLSSWLDMWGMKYDEATNGIEAVELAKKKTTTILFSWIFICRR